ncbi:ShlB/FhaC/HecB family hemolysin secretion/activation protein [uncultured Shewanella sp.]|uniref:ShlB/FhaC/HecB family hemolysin secretion/activation protein n=1 Tax=uncultured Shewanella sp. TaxID=173975 RepID=UPI002636E49F|nr:ShlB/FhaC/HecB family hemolysin secretion/activation protein [uncultured Shewanella sp.]
MRHLSLSRLIALSLLFVSSKAYVQETQPSSQPANNTKNNKQDQKIKSTLNSKEIDPNKPFLIDKIIIKSNNIFDTSQSNTFFIHRWANYLHINTRDWIIRKNLNFNEHSEVTLKQLNEAPRLLRAEPYIRDAKVELSAKDPSVKNSDKGQNVLVETWDNWSLLPTADFGSSGGNTSTSIGLKEDNLLGLGIKTQFKYSSDIDRTGYKFEVETPVYFLRHATLTTSFFDNDDGQATEIFFNNPFYSLETKQMYSAQYIDDLLTDTLRQNGEEVNEFKQQIDYIELQYGWLINKDNTELSRFIIGGTKDKNDFTNTDDYPNSQLPKNRDFLYPWIGYEYIQDDYTVLNDIYLINKNEDFNLGWYHYAQFGIETKDLGNHLPIGFHLEWLASRGYKQEDHLYLLNFSGYSDLATSQKEYFQINATGEHFYHINPKFTIYNKLRLSTSQNHYYDEPFALGDDTGLRGYPDNYQWGDNQWLITNELRYYPNINLYQLAELGWAAFTDIGQAFGGDDENNEVSGPIGVLGIGARVYSSKSSFGNVAHIDVTFPFTRGKDVNTLEFRFLVKSHF